MYAHAEVYVNANIVLDVTSSAAISKPLSLGVQKKEPNPKGVKRKGSKNEETSISFRRAQRRLLHWLGWDPAWSRRPTKAGSCSIPKNPSGSRRGPHRPSLLQISVPSTAPPCDPARRPNDRTAPEGAERRNGGETEKRHLQMLV